MRYSVFLISALLVFVNVTAAQVIPLTGLIECDVDSDGITEHVYVQGHRQAMVYLSSNEKKKIAKFSRRYRADKWEYSCADEDSDGKLEFVVTRNGRRKVFSFFKTGSSNSGDSDSGNSDSGSSITSCGTVQSWPRTLIYKTLGSSHFSPGDPRRNAVNIIATWGYRGYDACINILAENGESLGTMGIWPQAWSGGPYRWYGPSGCGDLGIGGASLAAKARSKSGSSRIYAKINNICYGPIDASRCVGSSSC